MGNNELYRQAHHKPRTRRIVAIYPNIAAVVEQCLTEKREPHADAVFLAYGDERLK